MVAYLTSSLSYYSHNKPGTLFNVKYLQLYSSTALHGQMVSNVLLYAGLHVHCSGQYYNTRCDLIMSEYSLQI